MKCGKRKILIRGWLRVRACLDGSDVCSLCAPAQASMQRKLSYQCALLDGIVYIRKSVNYVLFFRTPGTRCSCSVHICCLRVFTADSAEYAKMVNPVETEAHLFLHRIADAPDYTPTDSQPVVMPWAKRDLALLHFTHADTTFDNRDIRHVAAANLSCNGGETCERIWGCWKNKRDCRSCRVPGRSHSLFPRILLPLLHVPFYFQPKDLARHRLCRISLFLFHVGGFSKGYRCVSIQ